MDPITIGAAIGAAKAAVSTAKSVQELTHSLQDLWHNEQEYAQSKKKPTKKPKTRMEQVLRIRTGETEESDETSISTVANDVLMERQNELALKALAAEVDKKWGDGTWQTIVDEREKRIKAKEENKKKKKEAARLKAEHDRHLLKRILEEGGKAVAIVLAITGVVYFLYWAAQKGGSL
tara:strand:- start:563 stop:1096 length:534 start_codon:yes stop_codon:yes gene_type:complete